MLAPSATCLVHATTSSRHLKVARALPDTTSGLASVPVMPTSGTFWMNVPSVLPGLSPSFWNSPVRYSTVRSSPGVPGSRPSNASDDSALMCSRSGAASIFGMPVSGILAAGAEVAAGGGRSGHNRKEDREASSVE